MLVFYLSIAGYLLSYLGGFSLTTCEKAHALRTFLIKLSGRQMEWGKSFTNPALLAGLWVFLSMQEVLGCYSPEEIATLQETAQDFLM